MLSCSETPLESCQKPIDCWVGLNDRDRDSVVVRFKKGELIADKRQFFETEQFRIICGFEADGDEQARLTTKVACSIRRTDDGTKLYLASPIGNGAPLL